MHVVLNCLLTQLELLLGHGDKTQESMLDHSKLTYALSCVPWTSEIKDGRLPVVTGLSDPPCRHRLGHWKREFIKFVKVAPCILT